MQALKENTSALIVDLGNWSAVGMINHKSKKSFWSDSHLCSSMQHRKVLLKIMILESADMQFARMVWCIIVKRLHMLSRHPVVSLFFF